MAIRTVAYVDGFNLYHALCDLQADHLKWLDLWALCKHFALAPQFDLLRVYYFSAYATWLPAQWKRHRAYVAALKGCGVESVMGHFKVKSRRCKQCGAAWISHEEKETDVRIGVQMVNDAHRNLFDRALLISADSDLAPAVKTVKDEFPGKEVRVVTPPGRYDSAELIRAAGAQNAARIKRLHVEWCLLPALVLDAAGATLATRPAVYDPPP